jgi:hypothetical protein
MIFLFLLGFERIDRQDFNFFRWFEVHNLTIQQDLNSGLRDRHWVGSDRQHGLLDVLARAFDRWLKLKVFRLTWLGPFELNTTHRRGRVRVHER